MTATERPRADKAHLRPIRFAILGCGVGAAICFAAVWSGEGADSALLAPGIALAVWANLLTGVLLILRRMR